MNSPCLNCTDRQINCHSTCKKYLAYKKEHEVIKEQKEKIRQLANDYYGMKESKFKRLKRR